MRKVWGGVWRRVYGIEKSLGRGGSMGRVWCIEEGPRVLKSFRWHVKGSWLLKGVRRHEFIFRPLLCVFLSALRIALSNPN